MILFWRETMQQPTAMVTFAVEGLVQEGSAKDLMFHHDSSASSLVKVRLAYLILEP